MLVNPDWTGQLDRGSRIHQFPGLVTAERAAVAEAGETPEVAAVVVGPEEVASSISEGAPSLGDQLTALTKSSLSECYLTASMACGRSQGRRFRERARGRGYRRWAYSRIRKSDA